MNEEQFEQELQFLSTLASPPLIEQLRARDTAQREALARVEAERDAALQQVLDVVERSSDDIVYLRGQLAEAVRLMRELEPHKVSEELETRFRAFISRHGQAAEVTWDYRGPGQAEQQEAREETLDDILNSPCAPCEEEAQGAQAGDEQEAFCKAVQTAAKEYDFKPETDSLLRDASGEFVHAETRQLHRICQLYRAARATQPAAEQLWAVHAQGPDDLYAAFSREEAEAHAAALNAIPCPPGISVSAVVIESPWPAADHWKYLVEQEREHNKEAVRGAEHE